MADGTDGPKTGLPAAQELLPCPYCYFPGVASRTATPGAWMFYPHDGCGLYQSIEALEDIVQVAQRAGSEAAVAPTLAGSVAPDSSLVAENRRLREALGIAIEHLEERAAAAKPPVSNRLRGAANRCRAAMRSAQ
jgi:hypothetical protein